MSGGAQKRNLTAGKMVSYAWNKLGVWLVFIILFILLAFANEKFLLPANLINVVRQICVNAVVALGATYVVLCGEIDLSQSSLAVLAGCGCSDADYEGRDEHLPRDGHFPCGRYGRRRADGAHRHQAARAVVHRDSRHAVRAGGRRASAHQHQPITGRPIPSRSSGAAMSARSPSRRSFW